MTGRILADRQAEKRLVAQRALASCFAPEEQRRPSRTITPEAIERGAKAIYGAVTRTSDQAEIDRKWASIAKPITKDRHRAEAEACLRAAN